MTSTSSSPSISTQLPSQKSRHGSCCGAKVAPQRAWSLYRQGSRIRRRRSSSYRSIIPLTQDRGLYIQRWSHTASPQHRGHYPRRLSQHHLQYPRSILAASRLPSRPANGLRRTNTGHGHPQRTQCRSKRRDRRSISCKMEEQARSMQSARPHPRLSAYVWS